MATINITSAFRRFDVVITGEDQAAFVTRRIVEEHAQRSEQLAEDSIKFEVPLGEIRAVLAGLASKARLFNIRMTRDEEANRELRELVAETKKLKAAFTGTVDTADPTLEPGFHRVPRPHQALSIARLHALPHGANFSVPGAGKTTVTLALFSAMRLLGVVDNLLVLCPRNAFRPWEEEAAECFANPPRIVRLTDGTARIAQLLAADEGEIYLVSYQQAYFAYDELHRWMANHPRVHLVLDESHKIKNPKRGAWAQAALGLAPLARRRDILSGTPAPHSLADLETQIEFLWPFQQLLPDRRGMASREAEVARRIRPLYVRTTKSDLELPKPEISVIRVPMPPIQAELYRFVATQVASGELEQLSPDRRQALKRHVVRLLQVASNPALVLSDASEFGLPPLDFEEASDLEDLLTRYQMFEVPKKLVYAADRVKERAQRGKKTIIWSSFVQNLEMIRALLKPFGPVVIHGGVPTARDGEDLVEGSREALIDRFKTNAECAVLIANPAACSESISLHKVCGLAIYVDRTFNAAAFMQSMDRIHRLGLPANAKVAYELLVSPGTIDEVVDASLTSKLQRLGRLLDDSELAALSLEVDDAQPALGLTDDDARKVLSFLAELRE